MRPAPVADVLAVSGRRCPLLRPARPGHGAPGELMLRWGIGAVLRLFVVILYAPLARVVNMSVEAALVSLVTFFFLTMMAEPLLLEYDR